MIKRIWRGWTRRENADAYEALLNREIFPHIQAKAIAGHRGITLLRRDGEDEVTFITIMTFESMASIKALAGDEPSKAYVPAQARALLSRWDDHAEHFELREEQQF